MLIMFSFIINIVNLLVLASSATANVVSTPRGTTQEGQEAKALLKWKDNLDNSTLLSSWKLLHPINSHYLKSRGSNSCYEWVGIISNELGRVT